MIQDHVGNLHKMKYRYRLKGFLVRIEKSGPVVGDTDYEFLNELPRLLAGTSRRVQGSGQGALGRTKELTRPPPELIPLAAFLFEWIM